MAQRVYLHVGTPKSGTTFLQDTLWEHRETLRGRGLLHPGKRPFDHNRASIDVRHGRHLPGGGDARVWDRLRRRIAGWDGTAVLSNEWYVEASDQQVAQAVAQLAEGSDEVHVVVTTRSLVRLVAAAWQESLKIGRGTPLEEFVSSLDDPGRRWHWGVLDPAAVATRWAGIVGPERLHVVTMPARPTAPDQLWTRFTAVLGVDGRGLEMPTPANESLSVQATRLLQEVGPALREEVDRHGGGDWRPRARWLRNLVVRDVLSGVPGDPIGLGEELVAALRDRSTTGAEQVRALGCDVSGDLDDLLDGSDRAGARRPRDVTAEELLAASSHLAVGLLRSRIAAGGAHEGDGARDDDEDTDEHSPGDTTRPTPAPGPVAPAERTRRWTFMVPSAFYAGGIARTVSTAANTLAARGHEVGIITLARSAERPYFDLDPSIRITPLQDRFDPERPDTLRPLARRDRRADPELRALDQAPSTLSEGAHRTFSALVDRRLQEELSALPPGVVVSTRPEFAVAAARWTDPASILLHQEHLSFVPRPAVLRQALRDVALGDGGRRRLDALLTLTEADLERWRAFLVEADPDALERVRTDAIPNPTPFQVTEAAPLTSKVVIAAGRFTSQKGFERLVEAWAPLARSHPDWQLRIYGNGTQHDMVARRVVDLGLGDRVLLPGVTDAFEAELAGAAVYAMSSRYEGLPMVLLEALSKGVPPVSFDCPEGPRQLIEDGVNGLLVPEGDIAALTSALRRLMDDDAERARLGAGALESARAYEADTVVDRWVALVEEIDATRR